MLIKFNPHQKLFVSRFRVIPLDMLWIIFKIAWLNSSWIHEFFQEFLFNF